MSFTNYSKFFNQLSILLFILFQYNFAYECHSCLQSCETTVDGRLTLETCDCKSNKQDKNKTSCLGDRCFVKIEFFPDESIGIIQKGCTEGLPKGIDSCHYAGQIESVHCYCQGNFCNNKEQLNMYIPQPLPTLECCECSKPGGDVCINDKCLRTCRGNYCLVDFDGVEQGCGLGIPRLQSFLRIPNYLQKFQGSSTCARYQAASTTSVHGCVCTKPTGMCNELKKMRHYQTENVIKRRLDDQNYCYSLHQRSYEHEFDKSIYNNSETCEGHYCFVLLTTSELVVEVRSNLKKNQNLTNGKDHQFIGKSTPRYEVLAGCLKVDSDEKVSLGCTVEYTGKGNIISKHCICDSHLCNIFDLSTKKEFQNSTIDDEFSGTVILNDDVEIHENSSFKKLRVNSILVFIILFVILML